MRYLPSFRALKCFETCVRTGTLSGAARELNITPGAVSRQITALEEQLGTSLMHRHQKGVNVSAQGQMLAERLSLAFASISEALDDVVVKQEDKTLTLNVYPTFAIQWLMPRLPSFYAVAPDVDLRIRPSLQKHPFEREEIDVAVMIGVPRDQSLHAHALLPRRFTPVCSPTTLEVTGALTPDAIRNAQVFYSDMHVQQWRMWLDAVDMKELDLPEIGIRFENSSLAYQAAREGVGFAIGQPMFLRADLESGRLVTPFPEVVQDSRPYAIVCRRRDKARPEIRQFMEWIMAAARATKDCAVGAEDVVPEK